MILNSRGLFVLVGALAVVTGCQNNPVIGGGSSSTSGSGGAAGAQDASPDLITCEQPIGTASLLEGRYGSLYDTGLSNPLPVIRVMMAQANCFRVVERGQGMRAIKAERELADSGELEGSSNMGGGQMRAADFVITPNIAFKDSDAGGGAGGLGALLPGVAGAVAGGIKWENKEAQTTLLLTNVRTGVQEAAATGTATKRDLGFGGLGFLGGLAGGGGAYQDTDIGKIVLASFVDSHNNLVKQLRATQPVSDRESSGRFKTAARLNMRSGPNSSAPVIQTLDKGAVVVPTGQKRGDWWNVNVESSDRHGWVHSDYLTRP